MQPLGVSLLKPLPGLAETSKGDGVAERFDGRDAVLPLRSRGSTEEICRPRLDHQRYALPTRACLSPESKSARGEQRDPDHLAEDGLVSVPPDGRADIVFRHQHLLQLCRLHVRKPSGDLTERQEPGWNVVRLLQRPLVEVVAPAVGDDPPLSDVAVELEVLEGKLPHSLQQPPFIFRRYE